MSEYGIDMKTFVRERDLALIDLVMYGRKKRFKKYARKYGSASLPKNKIVFMAGACKAILGSTSSYIKQSHRDRATWWLLRHGMKPWIE